MCRGTRFGDGGKAAEFRHLREKKGQGTNEAVFLERFLHQRRRPEHRVEETAVVDHREDRFLHQGLSVFYCQAAPQFENQSRYIDLARRRRSSRINPGISILPGHTSVQLPHWMHRLWMSSDDLSASNHAGRMGPMA